MYLIKLIERAGEPKQVAGGHINVPKLLLRPCVIVDCIRHFVGARGLVMMKPICL